MLAWMVPAQRTRDHDRAALTLRGSADWQPPLLLRDRANGYGVDALQVHADDGHHVVLDPHRNSDDHRIVVGQAGEHGALELLAVQAENHLASADDVAGHDVEALAGGAVVEGAAIAIAALQHRR